MSYRFRFPKRIPSIRSAAAPLLVVAAAALSAETAQAQSPEQRAELEQFRDSLDAVTDSTGLLELERRLIGQARSDRDNPMLHLRLGFLSVRLGDLGGNSHYDDAASEFQWSIDLRPTWPYPWYGMGLAEYGVGDSQVSVVAGLQSMLGKDALTRSALAFAKSAEVDPAFVQGLTELSSTALRQRVNIKLGVALDALRRASGTQAGTHPGVLLARGRVEREVGDADSALAAFRAYRETGQNRALGHLEVARTQFILGQFEGLAPYYEGAASNDSIAVAGYRADLAVIATDIELGEFDRARGADRAAFLRRFWSDRDQLDLRGDGERVQEHYRRLGYARRNFALASTNRHYGIDERYRSGDTNFDDRGIIYIRHGEPTDRASYNVPGIEPNESWQYARPDGDLIFHFIAREDVQDYKLVESVFDVLGFSNALLLRNEADGLGTNAEASQLLLSRERLSPIYGRLQNAGRISSGNYQSQERRVGQRSIAVGTTSDSYTLHFQRELKAQTEVLAVGRDSTGAQVHVTYAIAGSTLEPVRVSQGYMYSIRLRFVATDSAGTVRATIDTTRHFVAAAPVPETEHLVGRVAVTVPAGRLQYRVAVQQGEDAGVVRPLDSVQVAPRGPGDLAMSDLVLGSRSANLTWRPTPGDTVFFNPLRTYRRSDVLELYYELAGLAPGESYDTKLVVKKQGGGGGGFLRKIFGGGGAVSLEFEDEAAGDLVQASRSLALEELKPGSYEMEITVSAGEREVSRKSQPFQIVDE